VDPAAEDADLRFVSQFAPRQSGHGTSSHPRLAPAISCRSRKCWRARRFPRSMVRGHCITLPNRDNWTAVVEAQSPCGALPATSGPTRPAKRRTPRAFRDRLVAALDRAGEIDANLGRPTVTVRGVERSLSSNVGLSRRSTSSTISVNLYSIWFIAATEGPPRKWKRTDKLPSFAILQSPGQLQNHSALAGVTSEFFYVCKCSERKRSVPAWVCP
jgi:hypothetical protein